MDVREKLAELLTDFYGCDPMYYDVDVLAMAQHLIANGVTVQVCKLEDKKTNADRIRSMSDEELAMCLYEVGHDEGWDKPEYALMWLQQPAQGENNG